MNNINETTGGSTDTMSARLPDVARTLKEHGVHQVIVTYQLGPFLGMVFLDKNENAPWWWPRWRNETAQIFELLRSLLKERIPTALDKVTEKSINQDGIFRWNLFDDTLVHEHRHRGL